MAFPSELRSLNPHFLHFQNLKNFVTWVCGYVGRVPSCGQYMWSTCVQLGTSCAQVVHHVCPWVEGTAP